MRCAVISGLIKNGSRFVAVAADGQMKKLVITNEVDSKTCKAYLVTSELRTGRCNSLGQGIRVSIHTSEH